MGHENPIGYYEKELLNCRDKFDTIFELTSIASKVIDSNLTILKVNKALTELLGFTEKELVGTQILDYACEAYKHHWHELQEALWKKELPHFRLEACLLKKDKTLAWAKVTTVLFRENDKTYGFTVLDDITYKKSHEESKKQLQLALQQSEQAFESLRNTTKYKDDFISAVSHELRTPITTLKASLQLLDKLKGSPEASMLPKLIEQSNRSLNKVSLLITDLLNTSRINDGELELNKTWFNLSAIIEDCCNHIQIGGNYTLIVEGDLDLQVCADADRIEQVVVNLVNNATKYAPASNKIKIRLESKDRYAMISVIDQGPGIPAEKQPYLFNRYYRADLGSNQYSGLGLGLYICSKIIKKHEGKIGVLSHPGEGSTFWFSLPLDVK